MRKIIKLLSVVMVFAMTFSLTAFAAEKTGTNIEILNVETKQEGNENGEKISTRIPAPPVTGLSISNAEIRSDGYVYITVAVRGYGKNNYCTWDNMQATLDKVGTDGKPIVEVNYLTYKCGRATVGEHSFYFRTTSANSPWNTESLSTTFSIS